MHLKHVLVVLFASGSLAACATFKPPAIDYDNDIASAVLAGDPPKPIKVVAFPKLLPLPGQPMLKAVHPRRGGCFFLEGEVHALIASVLLRLNVFPSPFVSP